MVYQNFWAILINLEFCEVFIAIKISAIAMGNQDILTVISLNGFKGGEL